MIEKVLELAKARTKRDVVVDGWYIRSATNYTIVISVGMSNSLEFTAFEVLVEVDLRDGNCKIVER